jgi:regulator of extracellular matrix RemA (YlzA/DUF370 family)
MTDNWNHIIRLFRMTYGNIIKIRRVIASVHLIGAESVRCCDDAQILRDQL